MKTNTLSKIAVKNTSYPRTMLPASNDLNTTAQFGDFQPIKFKRMLGDSSMTVRMKDLVRAAPLVAPSFARLQQKIYSYFVPYSDLTQNYTHMMAQQPVRRGSSTFVPTNIATISKKYLSSLVLIGAKLTIYEDNDHDNGSSHSSYLYDCPATLTVSQRNNASSFSSDIQSVWSHVFGSSALLNRNSLTEFGFSGSIFKLNLAAIFPSLTYTSSYIPIANDSLASFFNVNPSSPYYKEDHISLDLETVSLDNRAADIIVPFNFVDGSGVTHYFTLAFRLSSFGKRLKKIIHGLGDGIDFNSDKPLDFLKYIGYYKAYFEGFAPKLYDAYETTHAYNLQWYSDQASNNWNMDLLYDDVRSNDFWQFIIDLGQCFYTDEQDFVSAHIRSTAVTPSLDSAITSFNGVDVDSNNNYNPNMWSSTYQSEPSDLTYPNGHAFINGVVHGQLDSELLKKLYKWTNRNTIAGRKIEDLLRAQGLGPYVDSLKSHFIGYADHMIPVSDVTSQADTFDSSTNTGALLGEQNGKAVEYFESDSWTYETKEAGYWFTMMTVVPVSGYCEQEDPTSGAVSKWTMYNPEFDGLGYEFTPKSAVHGNMNWQDFSTASGSLDDSFGLIPRYSGWKITNNLLNGDFALRSRQNSMLPYTLDKFIDVGERIVENLGNSSGKTTYVIQKSFRPVDLPIAGTSWRYLTKYPFIGLFTRIFANVGDQWATANNWFTYAADWTFFSNQVDHFIVQGIFDGKYYAPVLPMADSFETKDEGNEGKANGAMTKA